MVRNATALTRSAPLAAIMQVWMRRIAVVGGSAAVTSCAMAPDADPRFQQAMDELIVKVDKDNVLAAAAVFQRHAEKLESYLVTANAASLLGLCGDDPISHATLGENSFAGKIATLHRVHWDHQRELLAVADRLFATARQYGYSDADIAEIMKSRFATW